MNTEELLNIGIKFHGHKCPAMPLGIRAGLAAMDRLGVSRASNKELFCFVETGPSHATMCFVDGVQIATGCTYGKANIEKLNYGKNALILIDIKGKKSIRISLKPEFQIKGLSSEFVKLREKGFEPKDIKPEIVVPMIEKIMSAEDEEILKIGEVEYIDFKSQKGTYYWERCEKCKEVVFSHGLKVIRGKHYCIPCFKLESKS